MEPTLSQHLAQIDQIFDTTIAIVLVAAAAFVIAARLTRLQSALRERRGPLQRLVPWLPVMQIAVWVIAGLACFALLLRAPAIVVFAVLLPASLALVVASRDLARNGIAGAVLAFEHSILAGDLITVSTEVGDVRGQVVSIGVRRTLLRRTDGSELLIPNETLLNSTVRTNRSHELDSAVEIELSVQEGFDTAEFPRVSEVARSAAAVSRYASPHRKPEVFLETAPDGRYRVTVQAYAFAPDYVRHLRTDVVSLFNEGLAQKQGR